MKKLALVLLASLSLCMGIYGQILVNVTGASYLAGSGLMVGGGFGMELAWDSMFSDSDERLTCLTLDCEFLSVPDSDTMRDGGGFVMPLVIKERYIAGDDLCYNLGLGLGLVLMTGEYYDSYYDEWWLESNIGFPVFVEAGCQWWLRHPFVLTACLRGGAMFSEDSTYPFAGLSVRIGIYLEQDDSYYY